MAESYNELPIFGPCATCGGRTQYFESDMPFGRTQEVWRVVCACGLASRWSVTKTAAASMWKRYFAAHESKRRGRFR